jgi:muramoyltetrapeptide carboxypeptidase
MRPTLQKGDTIMIISPSWYRGESRTYPMEVFLNNLGFEVETHPQCLEQWGQFSGTIEERITGIHEAFQDSSVDGIICGGGGYGALQLLEHIDYDIIKKNPKVFMGYSDVTALLGAFYSKAGLIGYHGPMGCCMSDKENPMTTEHMMQILLGEKKYINLSGDMLNQGQAEGLLLGGNMTLFDQLLGTKYLPISENIILLHLKHTGYLDHVRGVILGEMDKLTDNEIPFGRNTQELIEHYLPNIPSVMNVKCGHEESLLTFPYGETVQLKTGTENKLTFK